MIDIIFTKIQICGIYSQHSVEIDLLFLSIFANQLFPSFSLKPDIDGNIRKLERYSVDKPAVAQIFSVEINSLFMSRPVDHFFRSRSKEKDYHGSNGSGYFQRLVPFVCR